MKKPANKEHVLFGGTFVLANKLQLVGDQQLFKLSIKQWFLLRNLRDLPTDPPPTLTMLAKETDTSRQNVRKMLEALQRQGYVALSDNERDHRSQIVQMTDAGQQILRQMAGEAGPFFEKLFSGTSAEERAVSANVILKMIENLQAMQQQME